LRKQIQNLHFLQILLKMLRKSSKKLLGHCPPCLRHLEALDKQLDSDAGGFW
jgi:hypothetical protein